MTEKRREEIYNIYKNFGDTTPTAEEMARYCANNDIEYYAVTEYADVVVQMSNDVFTKIFLKKALVLIQELKPIPEYAPMKLREELMKFNSNIEIEIAKIIEEEALPYYLITTTMNVVSSFIRQPIERAGTTISRKAVNTMMSVCKERFGGEFNAKHSADYMQELYDNYEKKNQS